MDERLFTYSENETTDLILRIYPRIIQYINALLRGGQNRENLPSAEDVFHDVLCTFLDKRAEIRSDKVPAYLFSAVRNRCRNILGRRKEENSALRLDSLSAAAREIIAAADFEGESEFDAPEFFSAEVSPQEVPELSEILGFSNSLTERTREIWQLSRIEGLTQEEIARRLGISTRAVQKHLQTSVQQYRRHFKFLPNNSKLS